MKIRLHKIRRLIRIPLPMLVLLFLCNFSWAAEHQGIQTKKNDRSGFIHAEETKTVLGNVPSICLIIQSIINNQLQNADLAEPLQESDVLAVPFASRSFTLKQDPSSDSIAINAP